MTKRNLPAIEIGARPGVRSDVSQDALHRWMPDLRAATEDETTITILDVIGFDIFDDGVTARRIAAALRRIGDRPVQVVINSPGGDVFEGLAIYNLLREHPQPVTVHVVGLAASAASIVAMAGDEVRIGRAAFLMIHNAWVVAQGDRNGLREIADWLAPFDDAMADVYAQRSGMEQSEISRMMNDETWIAGPDAVERGLADGLLERDEVAIEPREGNGQARRVERAFDALAARAQMPRREARELLAAIRNSGKPGAAHDDKPGAVDIAAELRSLREMMS